MDEHKFPRGIRDCVCVVCVTELCKRRSDKMKKMGRFGNDIQYPLLEFLNWSPQTDRHQGGHQWRINQLLSMTMKNKFGEFIKKFMVVAS